ncbi:hypothetical protein MWU84_01175 [Arenibacter sp. F20364]|nr:hypothetical protein [Arenibacter sp. F20364]
MILIALLVPICICLNYMVVFPEAKENGHISKEPVQIDEKFRNFLLVVR